MKQINAKQTLVLGQYFRLIVLLKTLLGQWSDAAVASFGGKLTACLLDIAGEKRCHTIDTFGEYYGAVAYKWSRSV